MSSTLIVLDTETATARGTPHLLELGALRIEGEEVVDRFESLVRPQIPIDEDARRVHGIGEADVRYAPPAALVIDRFLEWLGPAHVFAGHNGRFDLHVLAFECLRAERCLPDGTLLDTLRLARRAFPDSPDHKLDTLCRWLAIEGERRHRAMPDAEACWQVLRACLARFREREPAADLSWTALAERGGQPIQTQAAIPAAPRLAPRLCELEQACREKRRVVLVYGEEPALSRMTVLPRILFQHDRKGYLEAQCTRSGLLKTYRLDRIHEVVTSGGD
jgi:DNA polymerase III epsilon subunit-like protein